MRMFVTGQHDRDRSLDMGQPGIGQRPADPGRVHDVAVAQQHQDIDALLGHRRLQPRRHLAAHPVQVGFVRDVQPAVSGTGDLGDPRMRRRRHDCRPRNFWMFVDTILAAFSGPTASTTVASDFSEYPKVDSLCG